MDYFISYSNKDKDWAEWIAWQVEEQGDHAKLQAWDFGAGSNFILEMNSGVEFSERTIAVLSKDYLESLFTRPEWAAAFAKDPTGAHRSLVPVRVRDCEPEGLLRSIVYVDLLGDDDRRAREKLMAALNGARQKPATQPPSA